MRRIRARYLFARREVRGAAAPLASATKDGVVLREDLEQGVWNPGDDISTYKLVEPGDFVIGLRSFQHGLSASAVRGLVSPAYTVLRSTSQQVDKRYFAHYFRSGPFIHALDELSQGIRQGRTVPYEGFANLRLPVPPLEEQRRIADFLDDQVALVHRALELRRTQLQLLDERYASKWSQWLLAVSGPLLPLRRFLRSIADGPFGSGLTSAHYVSEGARVIRLGNLGNGSFRNEDAAYISLAYYAQLQQHSVLPGDLLVAGLGDEHHPLGRACLAPEDLGPAIVKADCYRVRLDESKVSHAWAALAMSSSPVSQATRTLSRGSTRARINTELARDIKIPVPDLPEQRRLLAEHDSDREALHQARTALLRSERLLTQRKQALITAAVTGQLDITTSENAA